MRLYTWLSGVLAVLLLGVALYTYQVSMRGPEELSRWTNQLVATCLSAGLALVMGFTLYSIQRRATSADRKHELRGAILINIFDTWDKLDDRNLQYPELPDGTTEKVLLTFLQPSIFEEAIRSGLFGAPETLSLSRQAAIIHIYNDRAQRCLQMLGSAASDADGSFRAENMRDSIDGVQQARETVVDAGRRLLILWTASELKGASARIKGDRKEDPRVVQIIEQHLPKLSSVSYEAGIQAKLDKAEEAAEAKDFEVACGRLDDIVYEVRELAQNKIKAEDAKRLIEEAERLREEWNCPS
jgi:hypothetical protein